MRIPLDQRRVFAAGDATYRILEPPPGALRCTARSTCLGQRVSEVCAGEASATSAPIIRRWPATRIRSKSSEQRRRSCTRPLSPADFSSVFLVGARVTTSPAARDPPRRRHAGSARHSDAHAMREDFDRRLQGPRMTSAMPRAVGLLTLALACLGIFGVVSTAWRCERRRSAFAWRSGPVEPALLRAIVRQVLTPMIAGGSIGLLLAIPVGLALNTDPFYLESTDPLAFVLALGVFATTGTAAALWPAYQVLRRNPMDALRQP
jgi:hypothetical protein